MEQSAHNHDKNLTKDCIFTALTLLMEQKDFNDITITEIAKKAGVSRMTYYRTYSSKEDILIQYFDEMTETLAKTIEKEPTLTPYDVYVQFFAFFQKHSSLIENLVKANLIEMILLHFIQFIEYLFQTVLQLDITDMKTTYQIHYHTGELFALTHCWLQNGKRESPEKMAELAVAIVKNETGTSPLYSPV